MLDNSGGWSQGGVQGQREGMYRWEAQGSGGSVAWRVRAWDWEGGGPWRALCGWLSG